MDIYIFLFLLFNNNVMSEIFEEYKNLKSFEVEFFDNSMLHRIMCKIKNIEIDRILIYSENNKTKDIKPKIGTNLTLNVYAENGIYTSLSRVQNIEEQSDITIYAIDFPKQNKIMQRREYFRANLNIPYEMTILRNNKTDVLEGETVNICGKGICIKNNKVFLPYDDISVLLKFKNKNITTKAEYVYSRALTESEIPSFYHAFMLTTIEQTDIDFIVGQCFLYQLS